MPPNPDPAPRISIALGRYFRTSTPPQRWTPSLKDPLVVALLLLVLVVELGCWRATEGYQLADSVEFMERARSLVRGQAMVDSVAIRPFGFSTVLVPFFALADWIGLPDQRAVAWAISLLQIGLGVALVAVAMRVGSRLADPATARRTGLVAGVLAGANPILLQYSSQPVSGLAAGVCAGLALDAVLDDRRFAGGLRGGLWIGAAFLMAFQSLLIAAATLVLLQVRDGFRRGAFVPPSVRGVLCGLAAAIVAQIAIDWVLFGVAGASLFNYLLQNSGSIVISFIARIGFVQLARHLYESLHGAVGDSVVLGAQQSPWFYVVELPRMFVVPALAALALGLVRAVARPNWKVALTTFVFLLSVLAMSHKGSKDFRLWLPLLPAIAALCARGWTWLAPRAKPARIVLDVGFAGALFVLGAGALAPLGSKRFAGYWRAMDWANARATGGPRRAVVASAYNWAVYLRDAADVDLVKLPWQLDLWSHYTPEQRAEDLAALEKVDLLLAHMPLLTGTPELLEFLAPRFAVVAAVHDQRIDLQGFGPIFVLERRRGIAGEHLFFEVGGAAPAAGLVPAVHFEGSAPDGRAQSLDLLDWSYTALPPQGLGWISYRWRTPTGLSRDLAIVDRITSPDESDACQESRVPGWGRRPTSAWKPGEIVSEGRFLVPARDPYRPGGPYQPIGGASKEGGRAPATLWLEVGDLRAIRVGDAPATTSADGFARVGAFELEIPRD